MASTHSRRGTARSQIALEFMIVYSFVLIIFLVMFGIAAAQRAATMSNEQYSNLQLVAQNIATYIDQAASAGQGFNATVSLPPSIGTEQYSLSVTSTGIVIANISIAGQTISATAYSDSRNIVSSNSIPGSTPTTYTLPTYTGTVRITNFNGQIYMDESPPQSVSLPDYMSTSQDVGVYVANFNGQNSYVSIPNNAVLNIQNDITVSMWLYISQIGDSDAMQMNSQCSGYTVWEKSNGDIAFLRQCDAASEVASTAALKLDTWYNVVGTYDGSTLKLYINGALNNSASNILTFSNTGPLYIGTGKDGNFIGSIADAQVYNTPLTSNEAAALYNEGIGGGPVNTNSLVGWWKLDSNANDYSTNNNGGTPSNVVYSSIAKVASHVLLSDGANAMSTAAGFITPSANAIGYTDANGIISATLSSNSLTGLNLTAYAYNGNTALLGNLVGWWPLTLGYGNTIYDLSGNHNTGTSIGVSWNAMPLNSTETSVAMFPGSSSYIFMTNSVSLNSPAQTNAISIFEWLSVSGYQNTYPTMISKQISVGSGSTYQFGLEQTSNTASTGYLRVCINNGISGACDTSSRTINSNTMVHVGYTYINHNITFYINGTPGAMHSIGVQVVSGNAPLAFGSTSNHAWLFNGIMSNIQIYNSSLSSQQVESLYHKGITGIPLNTQNLIGWWPLDGNANDYSLNNNSANNSTGVTYKNLVSSNVNQNMTVANFNGQNSYISIPDSTPLNIQNDITVSMWLYISQIHDSDAMQMNSGCYGYTVWEKSNGDIGFLRQCDGAGTVVSKAALKLDTWYNVVGTYDGSTLKLYINGVLNDSASNSLTFNSIGPLYIGKGNDGNFIGSIADVQIYNSVLSQQQVSELYYQGLPLISKMNLSFG